MATSNLPSVGFEFTTPGLKRITQTVTAGGQSTVLVHDIVVDPDSSPPPPPPPLVELYPPDVNFTNVVPLARAMPPYRIPVEEKSYGVLPDNKMLEYIRVTDEVAFKKANPRHHYSKTQPWNCDETRALVSGHLLDATNNYQIIRTVSNLGTNFEWSKTDNDKVYSCNNTAFFILRPSTNATLFTRNFQLEGWTRMSKGNSEGNMDNLDRYVPMIGTNATGEHCGYYDVTTDTLHMKPMTFYLPGGGRVDACTVTPSGSGLAVTVVDELDTGYQCGLYSLPGLNFIKDFLPQGKTASHKDFGFHQDGEEVMVHWNPLAYRRISNPLLTNVKLTNWNAQFNKGVPMAGHTNARNYLRPGWFYVSNTNHAGNRELFGVKLDNGVDASTIVERFGFAPIASPLPVGMNPYDVETKGVASPSGKMMMWNTCWPGQETIYAYVSRIRIKPAL